jgi:cytochrome P450
MNRTARIAPSPNLLDPQIYSDGSAWPLFRELRRTAPIFRHPDPSEDGDYFWAVSNYQGCVEAFNNHTVLTSEIYERADGRRVGSTMFNAAARAHPIGFEKGLQHIDNPEHAAYKRVVASSFMAKQVNLLRGRMREITREALRPVLAEGRCDFVKDIASRVPFRVLMEMIGIPADSRAAQLSQRISVAVFGFLDDEVLAQTLGAEFRALILDYADERRIHPQDDLLTLIANAKVNGRRLEGDDMFDLLAGITAAGFDTTVDAVSLGLARLIDNPDQMQRLRNDMSLLPTAIDEILRYDTVVLVMRRTARQPIKLLGETLLPDDKVMLFLHSANRDEAEFRDPERFDIGRRPNHHLSLGHGLHRCLGLWLLKAEIAVILEETLAHMDDIQLAGQPDRLRTVWVTGLKRLPIEFRAKQGAPVLVG